MSRAAPESQAWIRQGLAKKGWEPEKLSAVLLDAGYDASPGAVSYWLSPSGGWPRERTVKAMEKMFDLPAPPRKRRKGDDDALLDAIERLIAEVRKLPMDIATAMRTTTEQPPAVLADLNSDAPLPPPEPKRRAPGTPTPIRRREPGS